MKIAIASDHEGFDYKEQIKKALAEKGHEVEDFGTDSTEPCDYPDFIRPAGEAVSAGRCHRGIVLGGSGNGEAIAANKVSGIRCALCWNAKTARLCREHNDANMLSMGAWMVSANEALAIVDIWLASGFKDGRHRRRISKIEQG